MATAWARHAMCVNRPLAGQEIPCILLNSRFHYRVYKIAPFVPVLPTLPRPTSAESILISFHLRLCLETVNRSCRTKILYTFSYHAWHVNLDNIRMQIKTRQY